MAQGVQAREAAVAEKYPAPQGAQVMGAAVTWNDPAAQPLVVE